MLYWLDRSRRDLVRQSPKRDGTGRGTFSLRSPVRPNPIGTALASLVRIEGASVLVRGLDCVDGTPLVDLKPDRCGFTPLARASRATTRWDEEPPVPVGRRSSRDGDEPADGDARDPVPTTRAPGYNGPRAKLAGSRQGSSPTGT